MLALSIDVFNSAYIIFGYYRDFPHFMGITYSFPFLYGPIFYLYARLISSGNKSFKLKYYLHFIPFLLVVIYGFIFVYLKSSEFKLSLVNGGAENYLPAIKIITYLKPVHGMIYVFLTVRTARDYNVSIRNSYSNIERINLNWLRYLVTGLSFVWGVVVLSFIINAFSAKEIQMDFLIYLAASILIYSIGYLSLHQPQVFGQAVPAYEAAPAPAQPAEASYQKSGLTDKEAGNYLDTLLHIMETDKLYLNSELNLRDLAERLSISTHNLSEVLPPALLPGPVHRRSLRGCTHACTPTEAAASAAGRTAVSAPGPLDPGRGGKGHRTSTGGWLGSERESSTRGAARGPAPGR